MSSSPKVISRRLQKPRNQSQSQSQPQPQQPQTRQHPPHHPESQAFQQSITKYLQRQSQKKKKAAAKGRRYHPSSSSSPQLQSDIRHYTQHAIHILETLTSKRESLTNGVEAFRKTCRECTVLLRSLLRLFPVSRSGGSGGSSSGRGGDSSSSSFRSVGLQEILTHFFIQYIHLRDGIILLTSGECRHRVDASLARRQRATEGSFPSLLNRPLSRYSNDQNSEEEEEKGVHHRKDGYTRLYSSKRGYSGYGWDEFHNEDAGIRRRLLEALSHLHYPPLRNGGGGGGEGRRNEIWDCLLEYGAEGFDGAFDRHEVCMKDLQRGIEDVRRDFLGGVERVIASFSLLGEGEGGDSGMGGGGGGGRLLHMVTEDKFERLELKTNDNGAYSSATTTTPHLLDDLAAFTIQRQGDAFEGKHDGGGAVPTHASVDDWMRIMRFTARLEKIRVKVVEREGMVGRRRRGGGGGGGVGGVGGGGGEGGSTGGSKKRKRLVIDDDSDDEENDEEKEDVASSCLKVTITKKAQPTLSSSSTTTTTSPNSSSNPNPNNNNNPTSQSLSVHDIKRRMGVDVQELERAREGLEAEEKVTKEVAYADEMGAEGLGGAGLVGGVGGSTGRRGGGGGMVAGAGVGAEPPHNVSDEMYELHDLITEERENVQMLRAVCKRKDGNDDEEAWDAKESLREAIMTLGILLLELHDASSSSTPTDTTLAHQAQKCFEEAVSIVQNLERANQRQPSPPPTTTPSSTNNNMQPKTFRTRALLLCRGRALTNLGRSFFERACGGDIPKLTTTPDGRIDGMSRSRSSLGGGNGGGEGMVLVGKAVRCLRSAEGCARSLRARAVVGMGGDGGGESGDGGGAMRHKIEADELVSLAGRWKGQAEWSLGRRMSSIEILRRAAGRASQTNQRRGDGDGGGDGEDNDNDDNDDGEYDDVDEGVDEDEEIVQAKIRLLIEWYHCAGALVLAATSAMGPTAAAAGKPSGSQKQEEFYLKVAREGYDRAAFVSDRLVTFTSKLNQRSLPNSRSTGGGAGVVTFEDLIHHDGIATREHILRMRDELTDEWNHRHNHNHTATAGSGSSSSAPSYKPVQSLRNEISGRRSLQRSLPRTDVNVSTRQNTATAGGGNGIVVVEGDHIGSNRTRRRRGRSTGTTATTTAAETSVMNGPRDDAFDNFNVFTGEDDHNDDDDNNGGGGGGEGEGHRPWGDEVLKAMGCDICAYPACEPPRPPEMIRELGLTSGAGSSSQVVQ